jgi:hypothetical protein
MRSLHACIGAKFYQAVGLSSESQAMTRFLYVWSGL